MSQHLEGDGLAFNDGTTTISPIQSSEGPKLLPHFAPTQDICIGQILTPHPIRTSQPGATDRNRTLLIAGCFMRAHLPPSSQSLVHGLALPPDSWHGPFQWDLVYGAPTAVSAMLQTASAVIWWCSATPVHDVNRSTTWILGISQEHPTLSSTANELLYLCKGKCSETHQGRSDGVRVLWKGSRPN